MFYLSSSYGSKSILSGNVAGVKTHLQWTFWTFEAAGGSLITDFVSTDICVDSTSWNWPSQIVLNYFIKVLGTFDGIRFKLD